MFWKKEMTLFESCLKLLPYLVMVGRRKKTEDATDYLTLFNYNYVLLKTTALS